MRWLGAFLALLVATPAVAAPVRVEVARTGENK